MLIVLQLEFLKVCLIFTKSYLLNSRHKKIKSSNVYAWRWMKWLTN